MVKKQSTKSSLPIALSGMFIAVAGFNIGSRFKPTAQDPAAYGWWAGVVLVALGVWLWRKRRGFAMTQLRELATLMAKSTTPRRASVRKVPLDICAQLPGSA